MLNYSQTRLPWMLSILILLPLLSFTIHSGFMPSHDSQTEIGYLDGVVIDNAFGTPIPNAKIEFFQNHSEIQENGIMKIGGSKEAKPLKKTFSTDQNGKYRVQLPLEYELNFFTIKVSSPGYESGWQLNVFVEKDSPLFLNHLLSKPKYRKSLEFEERMEIIESNYNNLNQVKFPSQDQIDQAYRAKYKKPHPIDSDQKAFDELSSGFLLSRTNSNCPYSLPSDFLIGPSGACQSSGLVQMNMDDVVAQIIRCEVNMISDQDGLMAHAIATRTFGFWKNDVENRSATCGHCYDLAQTVSMSQMNAASTTSGMILIGDAPNGDDYGDVIEAFYSARCNGNRTLAMEEGIVGNPGACSGAGPVTSYLKSVSCSGHPNCSNYSAEQPCCNLQRPFNNQAQTHRIYGHGVGLCQRGTEDFSENKAMPWYWIVKHYYTDVCITNNPVVFPDNCGTAFELQLSASPTWHVQEFTSATASNPEPNSCDGAIAADVWFSFTTSSSGTVIVECDGIASSSTDDVGLRLYDGPCTNSTLLDCDQNSLDSGDEVNASYPYMPYKRFVGLQPNHQYFLRVWDFQNDDTGPFKIRVRDPSTSEPDLLVSCGGVSLGTQSSDLTADVVVTNTSPSVTLTEDFYLVWSVSKEPQINEGNTQEIARTLINTDFPPNSSQSYSISELDIYSQGLKHGTYYLIAVVDSFRDTDDFDRSNNLCLFGATIDVPRAGNGRGVDQVDYRPKLSLKGINQPPQPNQGFTAKFWTRNFGKEAATVQSTSGLYWSDNSWCGPSDGSSVYQVTIPALSKSSNSEKLDISLSIPSWYVPGAPLFLCGFADISDDIDEGVFEGDNCECKSVLDADVGIFGNLNFQIQAGPNPTTGPVSINLNNLTAPATVSVWTNRGNLVIGPLPISAQTTSISLNLSTLSRGVYFVVVDPANERPKKKTIVKF